MNSNSPTHRQKRPQKYESSQLMSTGTEPLPSFYRDAVANGANLSSVDDYSAHSIAKQERPPVSDFVGFEGGSFGRAFPSQNGLNYGNDKTNPEAEPLLFNAIVPHYSQRVTKE